MGSMQLLSPLAATMATPPVGPYVNGLKAIPILILLLIWARLLTWADKDAEPARLPRVWLNLGMMVGLIVTMAALMVVPGLIIALALMVVVAGAEAGIYLALRNKTVGLGDLSDQFKAWLHGLFGRKHEVKEVEGAVQVVGRSGSLLPAPTAEDPEYEAFTAIQSLMTAPLENGAQVIEFAPAGESGATAKYSVDGIVYTGSTVSRSGVTAALAYLKDAASLDVSEVRKPQTGTLKLNINKQKRELQINTRGTTAGEFARFVVEPKKRHSFTLETLGMLEDQIALIRGSLKEGGIVLVAAPKGQGLTALSYAMLRAHDAFLEHLLTVERDQEQDLEGVTQNALAANASPEDEFKQVSWIVSQIPDVLLVSKPQSRESVREIIKIAKDGKRAYVSLVASDTNDALTQWRKLVGDDKLALSALKMVVTGRLLRRLCVACKQEYKPDPATLKKLNIDPKQVDHLYQAPKEPPRDPKGNPIPCEFCNDLRYKGRSGFYEILVIDDEVRQVILNGGTPAQMKTAFRKQRGRYLQEAGLALVEKGETSVQEVLRVLRPESSAGQKKPAA